jgi:hypothetical protein
VAALLMLPTPVLAGPSPDDGPKSKPARKLILEGQQAAEGGDYATAVEKYQASFELEANAVTLWGWAQATRQATGCRDAVPLFQRFSRMVEEGSAAYDYAREAIVDCADEMVEEDETATTEAPTESETEEVSEPPPPEVEPSTDDPPPDRKARPWHRDPLGGVLVGVGAATAAAGAGVLIAAQLQSGQGAPTYGMFAEKSDRIDTMRIAGGVVLGVGAALLIGGVVRWAILGAKQKRGTALRLHGPGLTARF